VFPSIVIAWGILPAVRVTVLSGGIGGARFTTGLVDAIGAEAVTVIGNVGDDLEHWGLHVSPDIDTVLYTLSGRVGDLGWGVRDDPRSAMGVVAELGGADWFILGDGDIGLHLVRTERLRAGEPLSAIVADVVRRWEIGIRLIPATDDRLRTMIATDDGELEFQEWFVGRRAAPAVLGVRFDGAPGARPAPGVLEAIRDADRIVLAPSNPFISVDPILAVDGVREAVAGRIRDVVAVSPIIGGEAVKGPLAAMLDSLGPERSALGVARHYAGLCGAFVVDERDAALAPAIAALGMRVETAGALMRDPPAKRALAEAALRA
jgi:LPPG:FO 2-phospho-L-lactate transferase